MIYAIAIIGILLCVWRYWYVTVQEDEERRARWRGNRYPRIRGHKQRR